PPTLIVNIPQFRLFLIRSTVDSEAEMLRMNVIVGKAYPQLHTPIFTAEMKAVLLRPYWEVPASIARGEIVPILRKNPRYLDKENLELVSNTARGSPCPDSVGFCAISAQSPLGQCWPALPSKAATALPSSRR